MLDLVLPPSRNGPPDQMHCCLLSSFCWLQIEHHASCHVNFQLFQPLSLQEYFLGRGGMFGLLPALTGESLPGARPVVAEVLCHNVCVLHGNF